jgi:hypothetical protein
MSKLEIKKCVLEIIDSLCDRKGFDDWWYNLGDDIEEEITTKLESIIERRVLDFKDENSQNNI